MMIARIWLSLSALLPARRAQTAQGTVFDPGSDTARLPQPKPSDTLEVSADGGTTAAAYEYEFLHANGELLRRTRRLLGRLADRYRVVVAAKAKVASLARRVQRAREAVAKADDRIADAERRLTQFQPPSGHRYDAARRVLSKPLYVLILGAAGVLGYLLDKGALLVLLLPRDLTETIALLAVFVTLVAAHWGGHILRRCHQVIDPRTELGRFEVMLGKVLIITGYTLAAVVALVRATDGGVAPGLFFLILGVLDYSCALVASYFVSHDGVARVEQAERARGRVAKAEEREWRALEKAVAEWRAAWRRFVDDSGVVVSEVAQVQGAGVNNWAFNHPDTVPPIPPRPAWLLATEKVAKGELPPELDITPILTHAGIDPREVL